MSDERLIQEAHRVYRRYQSEIVEGFRLCPWAERSRSEGHVSERVLLASELDTEATLAVAGKLADDENVHIGILIFPRLKTTWLEFERFVSRTLAEDARRRELGTAPFAMASFHPEAPCDTTTNQRLIPFLRRTPDPVIQLVRMRLLDEVRRGQSDGTQFMDLSRIDIADVLAKASTPTLRERIAKANMETVCQTGVEKFTDKLSELKRDRDESYQELGEPT